MARVTAYTPKGSDAETGFVCITRANGSKVTAVAGYDADDETQAVKYFDAQEAVVPFDPATETVVWGQCPLSGSHLIEGCIEVAGEKVAAFTIVNDSGAALFAPVVLTGLGFSEDCC